MDVTLVLGVSLLLQLTAIGLALRLIPITGRRLTWLLLAGALVLMVSLRSITFVRILSGAESLPLDPVAEWIALATSALLVAALASTQPFLRGLHESAERYRSFFENAPIGLGVADLEGNVLDFNDAMLRPGGYTREDVAAIGNVAGLYADLEERARALEAARAHGFLDRYGVRFKRKDGSAYEALLSLTAIRIGSHAGWLAMVEDVSEQRKAEEAYKALERQLHLSQRLEAVGRLAGGIAHDFNNLLTAILSHAQLLQTDLPEDDPRRTDLGEIARSAQRAAGLTRQLLAFSRRQVLQPRVIDLNAVVSDTQRLLARLIGEDVTLDTRLDPGLGRVKADPAQVEQVIMNLAVNARDAMPDGGTLVIKTANVELDDEYVSRHDVVRPGAYVMLAVTDTGTGMSDDVLAHIFEPFYTTKEAGKGTGLGLATVYGIVKQSGGYIWVYSEIGRGTSFKIYLPRVEEPLEPMRRRERLAGEPHGTETVLVVEDDATVRAIAARSLRKYGYTVLEAPDGEEALKLLERRGDSVQVLLSDTVMPGMSGQELAREVGARHRAIKVLYMSGYAADAVPGGFEPGAVLLQKPFATDALARAVRDALDGG